MGLNDEQEKFRTAKEWLETRTPGGMEWEAAYEHLSYVLRTTTNPGILTEAMALWRKIQGPGGKDFPDTRTDK